MAGAMSLGHRAASTVVVSISSARPWANFAMTLAVAGAMRITSAALARDTWATSYWKSRAKVSTTQRLLVRVSKVRGVMNLVAFSVMITWVSAPIFRRALATLAIL